MDVALRADSSGSNTVSTSSKLCDSLFSLRLNFLTYKMGVRAPTTSQHREGDMRCVCSDQPLSAQREFSLNAGSAIPPQFALWASHLSPCPSHAGLCRRAPSPH